MIKTLCIALLATLAASQGGKELKISFENLSGEGMSVLFSGNFKLNGQNYSPWNGQESFLGYLSKDQGSEITHWAGYNDRFVIRSPDSASGAGFKLGVSVYKSKGDDYPYSIVFQNIAGDSTATALELVHRGKTASEYMWIEKGSFVAHETFGNNPFTIRTADKEAMVKVTLWENGSDEL